MAFSKKELVAALKTLSKTDLQLKSSGQPPRSILLNAVVEICHRN